MYSRNGMRGCETHQGVQGCDSLFSCCEAASEPARLLVRRSTSFNARSSEDSPVFGKNELDADYKKRDVHNGNEMIHKVCVLWFKRPL